MLTKIGTIALRLFWESFALVFGFLLGAVPMLLLSGAIAWTVVDPGCACFAQKIWLAKVQIEQKQQYIYIAMVLAGLVSFLLLRRFKFGVRDLIDLAVSLIVFGGVYYLFAAIFKDLPSITHVIKIPFDTLVPTEVQKGFINPGDPLPFFPWKTLFSFLNSWATWVAATAGLITFFGFGDTFALIPKLVQPKPKNDDTTPASAAEPAS